MRTADRHLGDHVAGPRRRRPGCRCVEGCARHYREKAGGGALAESRARLDYAVRVSGLGFWYCDLPFDELKWDERVKEQFGLAPDAQVRIETFYDRVHPDDREPVRHAIEVAIRDSVPLDVEYRILNRSTGAVKWIHALGGAAYAPDGTPVRFDGVTVDVTSRKLDELRLARLLERERAQGKLLREVADAGLRVHSSLSLEGVLKAITEESIRILGARGARSSVIKAECSSPACHTVSWLETADDTGVFALAALFDNLSSEVCRANRTLRLTRTALEAHPAWQTDAGRPILAPINGWLAAPFVDRSGKNLGLIQLVDTAAEDFSDDDEAVLLQLAQIASVAIENARLSDAMRHQDRRKDEFLALLAHELRNPLAPLRNGLEVMHLAAADQESVAVARDMMDRQLGHMVRLIDDLLDISRISQNKMELRRNRVLLDDVVNSAIETARPFIEASGNELTVSLPAEPVLLHADLTRLAQVFSNLLTNSAKYTDRGGSIWLTAERTESEVAVSVRDTGIGIPTDALPRIFDMFSQVDRSIERSTGGLGIGLALVKALTEMHGGTVQAASAGPGRGTCFTVRLPLASLPEPSVWDFGNSPLRSATARRTLVVNDSRDSALSMAKVLNLLGSEVRTAYDGLEAVEVAGEFRPEVILMDVGMPRLNGYEATRRIRQQPWGCDVTIVALTGWGQEGDRLESKKAGCDGHLVKPVSVSDLQTLLTKLTATQREKTSR